jgi:hypothetical protein
MKQIMSTFKIGVFLALAGLLSCTSVTKQSKKSMVLDASQEDTIGGTGTSSADVRSMAERMARDISGINFENQDRVRIVFQSIENESRFSFNPNLIKDRLFTDLLEFSAGTKLQFTEKSAGANYVLSGRVTGLSKGSSEGVSDYLLYTFTLVDTDSTVVWKKAYETKKQGNVGVMYR